MNEQALVEDYFKFLRFKSVSAEERYRNECEACADWLFGWLEARGLEVEKWETSQNPILYATHLVNPKLPTVLLYGHYDVQPADPFELWKSDPFEPRLEGRKVYARGASDN